MLLILMISLFVKITGLPLGRRYLQLLKRATYLKNRLTYIYPSESSGTVLAMQSLETVLNVNRWEPSVILYIQNSWFKRLIDETHGCVQGETWHELV